MAAAGLFAVAGSAAAWAAAELPYSQNRVPSFDFRYEGTWTLSGVAGQSQSCTLSRFARHRLIGSEITVTDGEVEFVRVPFRTPVLGQVTYDTHSREFWLDFQTTPERLHLPRYVTAANLEMGTLLDAGKGRFLLDYGGVWFTLERAGDQANPSR